MGWQRRQTTRGNARGQRTDTGLRRKDHEPRTTGRRDLRLAKVQQKIAGTFRSATGATAFCRIRSYLSTMQKQGRPMLAALTAVFHGQPFPVAWAPE